ncbi:hypothetical protein BROUX41_000751 [Berkeleyomyces rouxiae]|uniref:uncharacterized protein n=1 Tax=Berkeleyomyces rouxiae TaxID=2035830 RepID=UPI003B78001B
MINRILGNRATRLALRSAARQHVPPQSAIRVQRVAFRAPSRPVRTLFLGTSALLVGTFLWTDLLDPYIFDDDEENDEPGRHNHTHNHNHRHSKSQSPEKHKDKLDPQSGDQSKNLDHGDEEEEQEIEGFFVAFPFTTQVYQPEPYRGSDPEWKEYIKFSKNKELQKELRDDLLKIVIKKLGADDKRSHLYMKSPRRSRMWLDYQYPSAPAPEYWHSGILYASDGVYWTNRQAESKLSIDLDRIIYPQLVASFIYQFVTQSATQYYENLRAIWYPATSRPQRPVIKMKPNQLPPNQDPGVKLVLEEEDPNTSTIVEKVTRMALGHAISVTEPMKSTWKQVGLALQRKWSGYKYPPPRGSIMLTGMVEVETPEVWVLVNVSAFWEPKEKEFHKPSMVVSVRGTLPKVQTPLR